jgi:flagellar hook assembly protein FlgD
MANTAKPTLQISPNPFNPDTNILCYLPEAAQTEIRIYNLKGQLVKQIVKDQLPAGRHSFAWNGRDADNRAVASGVYFFRISANGHHRIQKAVLMK